jgi:arylsulfatase A-like enzyme
MRHSFLVWLILAGMIQAADKPNVILILSDDLGYADLGVQGCTDIPTPNIDKIGKEGVRCTTAYSNGSFCTPTRAALMSGCYQHRFGVEDLEVALPLVVKTLPDRLRDAGYTTGLVGKWHLGAKPDYRPNDRGFDHFYGFHGGGHQYIMEPVGKGEYHAPIFRNREALKETRYLTDAFGDEAAAFVKSQRGATKPFFLYLAFNAVHSPLQAIEKYEKRFAGINDPKRRTYAAMLSAMDDAVGAMLTELDAIGQRDNTLVIFTNDNGGPTTRNAVNASRNTPLRGSKCETFEGGIRVPLVMRWPGKIQPGTTYGEPVISFDLTATVLAAAQADRADTDGVPLLPYLKGDMKTVPHERLFWRGRTMSNNYAARVGAWKYVYSTEGDSSPGPKQTC